MGACTLPPDSSAIDIKEPLIITKPRAIPEVKPGYKTTEFYKSSALEIIALLTAFGVLNPAQSDILNHLPDAIIAGAEAFFRIAGLITALISQWSYTKSRAEIKQQK